MTQLTTRRVATLIPTILQITFFGLFAALVATA